MWENDHPLHALVTGGHINWDSPSGGQTGTIYANDSVTPLLELTLRGQCISVKKFTQPKNLHHSVVYKSENWKHKYPLVDINGLTKLW